MAKEIDFFSSTDKEETPVEVLDAENRAFAVMPYSVARKQSLKLRAVVCIPRGRNNSIYLTRSLTDETPSTWQAGFSGVVHAGEAAEDAAWRLLSTYTLHNEEALYEGGVFELNMPELSLNACLHVFRTFPVKNISLKDARVIDGLLVDQDELSAIYRAMPDSFSQEFVWAWKTKILF